jgi:hypothetical protein
MCVLRSSLWLTVRQDIVLDALREPAVIAELLTPPRDRFVNYIIREQFSKNNLAWIVELGTLNFWSTFKVDVQ